MVIPNDTSGLYNSAVEASPGDCDLDIRYRVFRVALLALFLATPYSAQGEGTSPLTEAIPGPYDNALGNVWLFVSDGQVTSIEVVIQNPPCGDDFAGSTTPIAIDNDSFTATFSGATPSCPAVTVTGTFSGTHVSGVVERRWIPSKDCPCNASGSNGFFSNFREPVFFDGFEIGFGPG